MGPLVFILASSGPSNFIASFVLHQTSVSNLAILEAPMFSLETTLHTIVDTEAWPTTHVY